MRHTLTIGLFLCSLFVAGEVAAQKKLTKEEKEQANQSLVEADKFYQLQQYDKALEQFQKAYLISEHPDILFNIGQCYRLLNKKQEALRSYQSFIERAPSSPLKEDAEALSATLQEEIAKSPNGDPVRGKEPAKRGALDFSDRQTQVFVASAASGALGLTSGIIGVSLALRSTTRQEQGNVDGSRKARHSALAFGVTSDLFLAASLAGVGFGLYSRRDQSATKVVVVPGGLSLQVEY